MQIRHVLNYSGHPLSRSVIDNLENLGCLVETISVGVDLKGSISDQVRRLVDNVTSVPVDGSVPFMITLPGLSEITAFLIAEIHGRTGTFPKILQIRRSKLGTFELSDMTFAESLEPGVVDLETVRLRARGRRFRRIK